MKRYLLLLLTILLLYRLPCAAQVGGPSYGSGKATGTITACVGLASVSPNIQQFTVEGLNLTTGMEVDAPQYFELSLTATGGYQSTVTVMPVDGTIDNVTIYVRSSSSAPVGNVTGRCIISTSGLSTTDPLLTASVYSLPTVNPVPNQILLTGNTTNAINFSGTANTYTWVNDTPSIGLAASGIGDISSFTATNNTANPITATISVTATAAGFLYVPNSNDGSVSVINTTTYMSTGSITVGQQPYGITLTGDGATAYVSNRLSNNISVINTATNTVTGSIQVGGSPLGLSLHPGGGNLFVANKSDNTVSVVNIADLTEIRIVPVGTAPVNVLASPDALHVYVANSQSNSISVIDAGNYTVLTTIPVGNSPGGMALNPDQSRLYVANANDATISVINTTFNTVIKTIPLSPAKSPMSMVVSPDGSLLYVTDFASGTVSVVNTITGNVSATINVGQMPLGISMSSDGGELFVSNYGSNTVSVINTADNTITATAAVGQGPYALGNFVKTGVGCSSLPLKVTITVNPATFPTITATGTLAGLNTIYGTASTATAFTVSGANMTAGILVTPPPGFEVSTDDVNFSSTVTIGTGGNIAATLVYIRLAASTVVGSYSGNIVMSSAAPAASVNLAMPASTVTPAPLTITADDKSKVFEAPNPVLTASYSGFVNNDGPAKLTAQPKLSTSAVTTSPAGQYPITVSGAASPNYTFTYVPGTLTIFPPLFIPNTFTPNGDGVNDKWEITALNAYPDCTVEIFNRYGQNVYSSIGYGIPWNGTYKGAALPTGTYYYIIDLKEGSKLLSGFVAIVR